MTASKTSKFQCEILNILSLFRKYPEYIYNHLILINALYIYKSTILKCPPYYANRTETNYRRIRQSSRVAKFCWKCRKA